MQTKMAQNKSNAIDPKQDNNYFEFITLFFISCFILIDFLPQFRSIEIIGPQYIYLSFLNIIIGIYFYKNPEQISIDLIQILKKNYLIKAYLIFLLLSSASIFIAQNISLGIYSISRLFIGLCTLLNLSILLYKRLNLIYTIALIIGLSVFLQSINELYNFIQVAKSESIVDALGHLKGNTGNINIFSASLSIKIPFLLIGIVHFVKQKKWFLILSFLLATTLIFLSGSRSAFLSLTFETTIFLLLFSKIYPSKKIIISTLTTILLPIVLSFLISNFIFKIGKDTGRYQSVTSRVSQITNIKDASVNARLLYWDIAFKMIKEKPLMGIGLGNWLLESIPYERTISNDEIVSGHPHNDFLEIAAETGVLNGLIYFSIFIMALYINFKKIIKEENTEVKIIALLAILLLV
ncbi:MAG: O-antigen ligase, partial [bacterium]